MNKFFLSVLFLIIFLDAFAQTDTTSKPKKWTKTLALGVNINQASFSANWKGGGVNAIAFGGVLNGNANYTHNKITWTNELKLQYGQNKNAGQDFRKNADLIWIDSKYGHQISRKWNIYGSFNFLSQFDRGYRYFKSAGGADTLALISQFMAPGFLTESVGFEYKPNSAFWIRFGSGTLRQTFVLDTSQYRRDITPDANKNFGVPIGKKVRNEFAMQLVANFDKNIMENTNLKVRYTVFANYATINLFQTIDQRIDAVVTAKINKYISTTLTGTLIYDFDQDTKAQISQVLAIGLLYKFY